MALAWWQEKNIINFPTAKHLHLHIMKSRKSGTFWSNKECYKKNTLHQKSLISLNIKTNKEQRT
jgi:hypothetical protein